MKQPLTKIADWLQEKGQHLENIMIKGVSIDSRTVGKDHLFVPFRGEQVNGHRYVKSAIEKGAAAALWMKDEPNPPKDVPLIFVDDPELALQEMARTYRDLLDCTVIGITGSNGKTSTKDLVASVLSPYYNVRKTEGNFNNELGLPLTLLSLEEETEYAVLEMGMSGFGEISFLSKLAKPDYVILTNIGEAHMQDLGSRVGIAKAKFEIIDGLSPNGLLLYDGDEPLLSALIEKHPTIRNMSFGYDEKNDLALHDVHSTATGSDFKISGLYDGQFTIPVYGVHQVKNALTSIILAKEIGLSNEDIRKALSAASLTDMRMQPVVADNDALFINDAYNAAPTSMRAALSFLKETTLRPEKWVVLGDMLELGDEEKAYHESLSTQLVDMNLKGILLYGPRMKWLFDQLQHESLQTKLLWSEDDYAPLVNELRENTTVDSVILLKGSRGMALENILSPFIQEITK